MAGTPPAPPPPPPGRQRLEGLDLLRGIAVAGMILVNTPGSWSHVWWPLDHAEWHGWTPTDLVFPTFLFAMGVALGLSFPRRLDAADRRAMGRRVVRRSLTLIALGLLIQLVVQWIFVPDFSFATLRYPSVLQRIGVTYGLAAALAIMTARREEDGRAHLSLVAVGGVTAAILIGYWLVMAAVPVPGIGAGRLDPDGNLVGWIDRMILTPAHMYSQGTGARGTVVYDPEGLLSTIPSLANVLIGMMVATAWQRHGARALMPIAVAGVVLFVAGQGLHALFPINKKLWTSSFVLLTSGAAMLLLIGCVLSGPSAMLTRMMTPFRMLGMNAILAYLLGDAVSVVLDAVRVGGATLHARAFDGLLAVAGNPYVASHLYALSVVLIVLAIVAWFDRRGIHMRL